MKKIITMFMVMLMSVIGFTSITSAATTADIIQKLNDSAVLNVYVTQAESYLNSVTVTSEQADQIIAHIDAVNAIVGDKKKLSDLTSVQKQAILNEFTQAGVVMNLTVVYDSGNITITDSQERQIFNVTYPIANIIKQTGFDYSIILVGLSMLVIVIASAFVSRKLISSRK